MQSCSPVVNFETLPTAPVPEPVLQTSTDEVFHGINIDYFLNF